MLPADFMFSQTSLQNFVDCPALFELRDHKRATYPAAESEPLEKLEAHMMRGAAFHMLVQQHQVGVPPNVLAQSIEDDTLFGWWENYLNAGLNGLPDSRRAEIALSAPVGGYRLIAKYDLLAIESGKRAVIVDWKTSMRRSKREFLAQRLQTLVYPYVLVEAGSDVNNGSPIAPEQVNMMYWFAEFPDQPEIFHYDADQHAQAGKKLAALIADITRRGDNEFPLTEDVRRCQFCQYRGLHDRGTRAGDFDDAENQIDLAVESLISDFTLDQIAEIEF